MAERDYTIVGPDGREITIVGPDNATGAQLRAAAEKAFGAAPAAKPGADLDALMSTPAQKRQELANQVGGLVRGAGSIGATLLAPMDAINSKLLGRPAMAGNNERRADMDAGLTSMGADPKSGWFQVTKLGAEVLGTLGVGPAIAGLARGAGAVGPLITAVETGGFSSGALAGKAGFGARAAGGAITGAASAGLINPDDADTGAIVGGVLPGVTQVLGAGGRAVGGAWRGMRSGQGQRLADILETDPATTAAKLRAAQVFVENSDPTVAQVLRTPQASIAENVVSMSPGGAILKQRAMDQSAARMAALDRVAPLNPLGAGSARAEFGEALASTTKATDKAMRKATSAKFKEVPQDEAMIYLPDLAAIRDELFPASAIVNREAVDRVIKAAEDIGISRAPGLPASYTPKRAVPLSAAIRKDGGININLSKESAGELRGVAGSIKNVVRREGGLSAQRMAERMHEAGYLPDDTINSLLNALSDEAGGASVVSLQDDAFRSGGQVGSAATPQKVTLGQLETLRQDIGELAREAKPQSREKLALDRMRAALDSRVDEVVRGDGLIDENVPIDWANKLTDARKAKLDQVKTTGTGPQSFAMRKGQDGLPMYQSQELAGKAWRQNIPPEDVEQLRVLMDKNPRLLGQYRSMITSEAASTAKEGEALTGKFVKWTENALPGLRKAFAPEEVKALQRIAQDIKRANNATAAGAAVRSDTYQNAANALSLGIFDSPGINIAASKIPLVGRFADMGIDWMREGVRNNQAKKLAALFADPTRAAQALESVSVQTDTEFGRMLASPEFRQALLRAAPVVAADR